MHTNGKLKIINTITLEAAEEEGASSVLGKASRVLKLSEPPGRPTANPESYKNSNRSCLLQITINCSWLGINWRIWRKNRDPNPNPKPKP